MSSEQKSITNRDPKAGCIIMAIIGAVIGGLLFIVISTPFKQSGLMTGFTQEAPIEIATKEPLPTLPTTLAEKLNTVSPSIGNQESVEVSFSASELNDCIRHYKEFDDLKGKMSVKEITETEVLFNISFPLRGKPFSDDTPHLNGVMHTVPERLKDEIVLTVTQIESLAGEVPEGFLSHFQPYRILAPYSDHPHLGKAMFACTEIKLAPDRLTLLLDSSAYNDPVALEAADKTKKKERSPTTMLFSFLFIGVLFIVMVKRRNNRSAAALSKQAREE